MSMEFNQLVAAYDGVDTRERARELEAKLWSRYGVERAVLVLDSQGFTRRTQTYGLIAALAGVQRLRRHLRKLVKAVGGLVVKSEADNLFAVFPDVSHAVAAARALLAKIAAGEISDMSGPLDACIGIDHGHILLIEKKDLFGDPVNLASKLGEDVAQAGEIWLTSRAFWRLHPAPAADLQLHSLPGVALEAYRLRS